MRGAHLDKEAEEGGLMAVTVQPGRESDSNPDVCTQGPGNVRSRDHVSFVLGSLAWPAVPVRLLFTVTNT